MTIRVEYVVALMINWLAWRLCHHGDDEGEYTTNVHKHLITTDVKRRVSIQIG